MQRSERRQAYLQREHAEIRETLDRAQKEAAESQARLEQAQREQSAWRMRVALRGDSQEPQDKGKARTNVVVEEAQKALERARRLRESRNVEEKKESQQQAGAEMREILRREQAEFLKDLETITEAALRKPSWEESADIPLFQQPESQENRPRPWAIPSDDSLSFEDVKSPRPLYEVEGREKPVLRVEEEVSPAVPLRCSVEKLGSQRIDPRPPVSPADVPIKKTSEPPIAQQPTMPFAMPFMVPMPMYQMPMFSPYYPPQMQQFPSQQYQPWTTGQFARHEPERMEKVQPRPKPTQLKTPRKRNLDPRLLEKSPMRLRAKSRVTASVPEELEEVQLPADERDTVKVERSNSVSIPAASETYQPPISTFAFQNPAKSPSPDLVNHANLIESLPRSGGELVILEGPVPMSLSEAFQAKKRDIMQKLHSRPEPEKIVHPAKTKQELAQLRKQMMKPTHKEAPVIVEETKALPPAIERLVQGIRPAVSRREMLELTAKNYQQLPEVKRKAEEAEKKEALKQRLATAKAYERRRQLVSRTK